MKTYIFKHDFVRIAIDADTLEEAYEQLVQRVSDARKLGVDVGSDFDFNLVSCF